MSSSSEEIAGRGVGVTIKYGKGYEETWATFRGLSREVRDDIIEFFGIDSASVTGLTLSDVVLNATNIAHAKGNLGAKLGATSIPKGDAVNKPAGQPDEAQGMSAWESGTAEAAAEQANPNAELYKALEAATTVDDVKQLWAKNQATFAADAELTAAYKARGKALST